MMHNQASLQATKQHGAVRFPFNLYPCTIPGDFPQVALHWQESMEPVSYTHLLRARSSKLFFRVHSSSRLPTVSRNITEPAVL